MPSLWFRRDLLWAALGLALIPLLARGVNAGNEEREGAGRMSTDIVMLHGANEGAWVFDRFRQVFEAAGHVCHPPDLIGHGTRAADAAKALAGVSMTDYLAELEAFLETVPPKPVLVGHSMGAILAQQLAARGHASALVLLAPAPRSGILPPTDGEKQLGQDVMTLGPFWKTVINPNFDLAKVYTLNCVPEAAQRAVFDKFGPESGLAFFQMFFWMFDQAGATTVDTTAVKCPVLCLVGTEDRIVSPQIARTTADGYPGATFRELQGQGHMLVLEPGAENIARRIADWIEG
jgi:non-heme chloroperoxidase